MVRTESVKVYQMDSRKARRLGIFKFFEWELEGEKIEQLGSPEEIIAAIYDKVYETEKMVLDFGELHVADAIFNASNHGDLKWVWKGHTMSVSDIIQIGERFFYCDIDGGWQELSK